MPLLLRNISKKRAKLVNLNEIARKELAEVLDRQVKPLLVKSHNLVVADWQHRPKFQTRKEIRAARISITVFPVGDNADIFKFVDQGTKAHMIPASGGRIYPVKAKALAFAYGGKYQAKTLAKPARTVGSGGGGNRGNPYCGI